MINFNGGKGIMEQSSNNVINNTEVYKPNREQRRNMLREQKRVDKKLSKVKIESAKVKDKLLNIVEAIKEKAVSVKVDTCIDKMYFCINTRNYKDTLIIRYEGNEMLKSNLGVKTNVTLDNGIERLDNILIYVEVLSDNRVSIDDGKGVYLNDITK